MQTQNKDGLKASVEVKHQGVWNLLKKKKDYMKAKSRQSQNKHTIKAVI